MTNPDPPKIGLSRLNQTIPSSFSSFYLTLISMIQGVALSLLATKVPEFLGTLKYMELLYAFLTFAVIVLVWHEYVLAAQEFWWRLTWWDSLVPFLLGMGEFLMIEYLGKGPNYSAWFFACAFSAIAGFLAYVNYDRWINESDFDRADAFQLFKREVKLGRWLMILLALADATYGTFALYGVDRGHLFLFGYSHGTLLLLMLLKRRAWLRKALALYGWQR